MPGAEDIRISKTIIKLHRFLKLESKEVIFQFFIRGCFIPQPLSQLERAEAHKFLCKSVAICMGNFFPESQRRQAQILR